MKQIKKTCAVLLAVVMMFSVFNLLPLAASEETIEVRILSYNVSGLPDFSALLSKEKGKDVAGNQNLLGSLLEDSDYDIIAVQEDFGYHNDLIANMKSYSYKTKSSGSVPGGDGLNVFTRDFCIYDATRTPWNSSFGSIKEGDTLTPKGILYTVLDIGNGIYVDFYVLHADAFDGEGSVLSRADQYRQLMDLVNKNSADRPVIITGDFNTSLHLKQNDELAADRIAMRETIVAENGFEDAWIELKNGGNYDDFSAWSGSYWGRWDSVEKFFYRSGGGVNVTPSDFEYVAFYNADDVNISDHNAAFCSFTFEKTDSFVEDTRSHSVKTQSDISILMNKIKWIFKDLVLIFSNFDEIKELLG